MRNVLTGKAEVGRGSQLGERQAESVRGRDRLVGEQGI